MQTIIKYLPQLLTISILGLINNSPLQANCATNNFIIHSTPDVSFSSSSDNTVIDLKTNLMWQKCSIGQSGLNCGQQNSTNLFRWDEALQYVVTLNSNGGLDGYIDWRLPNKNELASLVEEACLVGTAINNTIFPNTFLTQYWSSTPAAILEINKYVWVVDFSDSDIDPKLLTESHHIRLVRDVSGVNNN